MHLYVFWRSGSVPLIKNRVAPFIRWTVAVICWLILVLGLIIGHSGTGFVAGILECFGMIWMAVLFLLTLSLLLIDLMTGGGYLLPGPTPKLRGLALAVGLLLSVVALVQGIRPPVENSAGMGKKCPPTVTRQGISRKPKCRPDFGLTITHAEVH